MYRQAPPYCVQIELTEGCNLRCPFCGLNGIRGKENNFKFLTLEIAERIAFDMAKHGWNSRLEFAMHGEPTMNPGHVEIVALFRKHLPRNYMLMESNGGGLLKNPLGSINELFNAGLNTLALDEYQNIKLVPKVWEKLEDEFMAAPNTPVLGDLFDKAVTACKYPDDGPIANPHQRRNFRRLIWIRPIDVSTEGTHSSLSNHCGAGLPPNSNAEGHRCAKPFRELSFRWDGAVTICCNDWRGDMPVGSITELSIEEIWHHPRMEAMRRMLYHGDRSRGACIGCDYKSYRPGLLPDHKGQATLPEATKEDERIIDEMLRNGPLTAPVLRPWEK
jgi:MoaA/NifB/PqqE/SkfB family radical SAM enzyme